MSWAACGWQGWVCGPRLPHLPQPLPPMRTVCRETVPSLDPERTNVHSTVLVNNEVWKRVFVLLFYLQVQKQQTLAGICDGHQPNVRPHPYRGWGPLRLSFGGPRLEACHSPRLDARAGLGCQLSTLALLLLCFPGCLPFSTQLFRRSCLHVYSPVTLASSGAVTDQGKQKTLISHCLESGSPKPRCQQIQHLVRALPVSCMVSPPMSSRGGERALRFLLTRALIPSQGPPSPHPLTLLTSQSPPPPPAPSYWWRELQLMGFGDTQYFYIPPICLITQTA